MCVCECECVCGRVVLGSMAKSKTFITSKWPCSSMHHSYSADYTTYFHIPPCHRLLSHFYQHLDDRGLRVSVCLPNRLNCRLLHYGRAAILELPLSYLHNFFLGCSYVEIFCLYFQGHSMS